jgi:hypothetical protein
LKLFLQFKITIWTGCVIWGIHKVSFYNWRTFVKIIVLYKIGLLGENSWASLKVDCSWPRGNMMTDSNQLDHTYQMYEH